MELEFSRNLLEEYSNIVLHENPASGSPGLPCRRMDRQAEMTQQIVAFRDLVNASRVNNLFWKQSVTWENSS
jgi:hypothetical protein